jgi:hypothetical protein
MRSFIEAELIDVHTSLPGIIQSFDPAQQVATVQPAVKRFFVAGGWIDLPPCMTVPVQFPRGGGFIITFPIAKGDECLLVFNERCIDGWWDKGGSQQPPEDRRHDLSDAVAIPGISSRGRVPAGISTTALELRTLDGKTVLRIKPGLIELGGDETPLDPAQDGLVHGRGIDPFSGLSYWALGNTSGIVRAKK